VTEYTSREQQLRRKNSRHRGAPTQQDGGTMPLEPGTGAAASPDETDGAEPAPDLGPEPEDFPDAGADQSDIEMADDDMPALDLESEPAPPAQNLNAVPIATDPLVGPRPDASLQQSCLSFESGCLRLVRAPEGPDPASEELVADLSAAGGPPPQESPSKTLYQVFGVEPVKQRVAPASNHHIQATVEVQGLEETLEEYLDAVCEHGDGVRLAEDHASDHSLDVAPPVLFGPAHAEEDEAQLDGEHDEEEQDVTMRDDRQVYGVAASMGEEGVDAVQGEGKQALVESQIQAVMNFLNLGMRLRGGDQEAGYASSEGEADVAPVPPVAEHLLKPVWEAIGGGDCCLKVLQACQLIAEYKETHRCTQPALEGLLKLLQALLPKNHLPQSLYHYRKVASAVLKQVFGGPTFRRLHLCSNAECSHLYTDWESRYCPECAAPRYEKTLDDKERAIRELRYMGIENGVRALLMSKQVGRAIMDFDIVKATEEPHSLLTSDWALQVCREYIPDFESMGLEQAMTAKRRFFTTGQVFSSEEEYEEYTREIEAGERQRTLLLLVEAGCDGFQPFNRRIWSTWMWGYRLQCVCPREGETDDMAIVTSICSGATEGKAAHVVAALDAKELEALAPPTADERQRGGDGVPLLPNGCARSNRLL
jgi:hypothetical protein